MTTFSGIFLVCGIYPEGLCFGSKTPMKRDISPSGEKKLEKKGNKKGVIIPSGK
jgi:hypothetical protein